MQVSVSFLSFFLALFGIVRDPGVRIAFFPQCKWAGKHVQDDGGRETFCSWLCDNIPLVPVLLQLMSYVVSAKTPLPAASALRSFSRGMLSGDFLMQEWVSLYTFPQMSLKRMESRGGWIPCRVGMSVLWVRCIRCPMTTQPLRGGFNSNQRPKQGPRTMSKSKVMDQVWQANELITLSVFVCFFFLSSLFRSDSFDIIEVCYTWVWVEPTEGIEKIKECKSVPR